MKRILFCALSVLAVIPNAGADSLIMPKELVTIAGEKACTSLSDFYDRPGPIDPPFAYGYLPGDKGNSAVFWCKNPSVGDKPYRLVIVAKDSSHKNSCPDHFNWWNPPKGLSIVSNTTLDLRDFRYLDNPKLAGPSQTHTKGNLIVSSYDGVSEYFYCHDGRWLFLVQH